MRILGIETSCDETSAAVVSETAGAWANRLQTSSRRKSRFMASGEASSRTRLAAAHPGHLRLWFERARTAGVALTALDAIAVTQGPGSCGSLLVGVSFAKSLRYRSIGPLVAVHHLAGHIESLFLQHGDV